MLVTLSDLEKDSSQWVTNISAPVNNKLSLAFQPSTLPDGRLKVTNVGNVPYAGGLVSRKLQIPQFVGAAGNPTFLSYAQLSTAITIPAASLFNIGRLETDLIAVFTAPANSATQIQNKGNCSTQLNLETGHFEIDAQAGAASWSDIGAGPGTIAPDVEHTLVINCAFDLVNLTRSVQSIVWDGVVYAVPKNLQAVPFQPSNWIVVASIQKQTEILKPGSADVIYRATTLRWSDQPF